MSDASSGAGLGSASREASVVPGRLACREACAVAGGVPIRVAVFVAALVLHAAVPVAVVVGAVVRLWVVSAAHGSSVPVSRRSGKCRASATSADLRKRGTPRQGDPAA